MECGTRTTVDFCDTPKCINASAFKPASLEPNDPPHLPTHNIVKIQANVNYWRETGRILGQAQSSLERAKRLLEAGPSRDDKPKRSEEVIPALKPPEGFPPPEPNADTQTATSPAILTCITCHEPVASPCWYCIDCPESGE